MSNLLQTRRMGALARHDCRINTPFSSVLTDTYTLIYGSQCKSDSQQYQSNSVVRTYVSTTYKLGSKSEGARIPLVRIGGLDGCPLEHGQTTAAIPIQNHRRITS